MGTLSFDTSAILGWLFESTLYISILVCVILMLKAVIKAKLPAWWSYGLWLLLIFRMLIPWGIESPLSIFNFFPSPPGNDLYIPFLMKQIVALPFLEDTSNIMSADKILLFIWFAGVLFFSITTLSRNFKFRAAIRKIAPVNHRAVIDIFEECRVLLSVRRKVKIVETEIIKSPALFGYFKPRLLLPKNFLNSLEKDELRCVFLHELGHLKNHDIGVSWLVTLLQAVHWFNPFVWYGFHLMRIDQEIACDTYVLSRIKQVNPTDYANTIVRLLDRFIQNRQLPSLAGIIENKSQIKRRITHIMNFKKYTYKRTVASVFMFLAVGLIFFTSSNGLSSVDEQNKANITGDNAVTGHPYKLAEIDQAPKILFNIPPKYPLSAKNDKIEGKVVLQFVIDSLGYPREPKVLSAEPEGVFDQAALDAVVEYRFQPAQKDGKPVACIVRLPVKFDLGEKE